MSYLTFFEGMIIGLFIFSAFFSLFLTLNKIERKVNLAYFGFALLMAISMMFNLERVFVKTPSEYADAARFANISILSAGIFYVYLISYLTGFKSLFFKISISSTIIILFAANIIKEYGLEYNTILRMEEKKALWNEVIFMPVGEVSSFVILIIVLLMLILIYSIIAIRFQLKNEKSKVAYILLASILLGITGITFNQLILYFENTHAIILDDIGYFGFIILIGSINFRTVFKSYEIRNKLEQNEVKYRTLFQNSGDGIMILDNGLIIDCNTKALELFNCSREEIINKSPADFSPEYQEDGEASKDKAPKLIKEALSGKDLNFEWHHKRLDGSIFFAEVSLTKIQFDSHEKLQARVRDISLNKEMESRLRASEFRFRTLVEGMNEAVIQVNENDEIIFINKKFSELLGYKLNEVAGLKSYDLLIDPSDIEFIKQTDLLRRKNIVSHYEINVKSKTGELCYVLVSGSPVYNSKGNFIGTFAVMTDITERKKVEKEVRNERENFLRIFNEAPIQMQIVENTMPYKRLLVNQSFANFRETSIEEAVKLTLVNDYELGIFPEEQFNSLKNEFETNGIIDNKLIFFNHPIRGKIHVLFTIKPIFYNENECILIVFQDVTEIEETKEELKVALNYMQFLVDSIQSAIIAVDYNLHVTHFNNGALQFDGHVSDDNYLFNKFPKLKFIEEILVEFTNNPLQKESFTKSFENPFGKNLHFHVSISTIKNELRPGYLIIIEDVTERKKIDDLMIQSEKMLSVAGLAAGMAHEINNPLGTIVQGCQNLMRRTTSVLPKNDQAAQRVGISMTLLEAYMKERQIYEIIESMKTAAGKAAEIIKNMLQFSRRSESKKIVYDIMKLIDESLELAYNDYDLKKKFDFKRIKIVKEFDESLPEVKLTVTEIEQVIFNILRNAAYALHDEKKKIENPQIIFRVYQELNYIVMEIEDNGPGIPKNISKRIFEPFFTTKDVGEGTGLGLSVSYMIIKNNHDGILTFKSEEGKGTNFIIKLPI